MSFPHGAMGWSVVCGCSVSLYYILTCSLNTIAGMFPNSVLFFQNKQRCKKDIKAYTINMVSSPTR